MDIWRETLHQATALGSEHLSSYEVIYEDDTPLFAQLRAGEFDVDEDLACAMYDELVARTADSGFQQYEIANFARSRPGPAAPVAHADLEFAGVPDYACRHNINYWRGGFYHGIGPSAAGYVRGIRTKNWSNTQLYCEQLEKGRRAIESSEHLTPLARAGEVAAFGLRMNAGWPFEQFHRATGLDLRREWSADMDKLIEKGWGQAGSDRFQLTPTGLRFADSAAELFLR
jgi:oxygen-independent coproporphyrinogen-3 oxidase